MDVDFGSPQFLAEPWSQLQRLQREAPIFYSQTQRGWIISRYEDVRAAYADRRLSSSRSDIFLRGMPQDIVDRIDAMRAFNKYNLNRLDGREHMRIRTLLLKAFDGNTIRYVEGFIGEVIDSILDECEQLREFDFLKVVSANLPAAVMQRLFALPDHYRPILFDVASRYITAVSAPKMTPELLLEVDAVLRGANEMFVKIISEREGQNGEDMISRLIQARDELNRLSQEELLAQLNGLVIAGSETTANTLGTQLVQIVKDPSLLDLLREQPERAITVVLELLRYPGTIKCFPRQAAENFELHGQTIRAGDIVYLMNIGANVDPQHFPDPLTININRDNLRDITSFSPGFHHCVGHMLAKTTLVAFFTRALHRFDVEILQAPLEPIPSFMFYGYKALRVRFTPRG